MYPAKASDEQVRRVIRDLMSQGKLPSGVAVRASLAQRYGCRGGVARIYRLLRAENAHLGTGAPPSVGAGLLQQEIRNLREQLAGTRRRDEAHQAHWSRQVAELRERVARLEPLVEHAAGAGKVDGQLPQAVQAAAIQGGRLDVLLRAFGPAVEQIRIED